MRWGREQQQWSFARPSMEDERERATERQRERQRTRMSKRERAEGAGFSKMGGLGELAGMQASEGEVASTE